MTEDLPADPLVVDSASEPRRLAGFGGAPVVRRGRVMPIGAPFRRVAQLRRPPAGTALGPAYPDVWWCDEAKAARLTMDR